MIDMAKCKNCFGLGYLNSEPYVKCHVCDGHGFEPQKVKCNCPCHKDKNVKHVRPCCENGYITLPKYVKP